MLGENVSLRRPLKCRDVWSPQEVPDYMALGLPECVWSHPSNCPFLGGDLAILALSLSMSQVHFLPLDYNVMPSLLGMVLFPFFLYSSLNLLVLFHISLPVSFPGEVLSDRFSLNYTSFSIIFCPRPKDAF